MKPNPMNAAVTMLRSLTLLTVVALTMPCASGADADLRTLRAQAIRQAASQVENSLARVEQFGSAESAAEVAEDAPTVAMAIDDQRHFIASAMVANNQQASLVLVGRQERRTTAKVIARDSRRQIVLLEAADDIGTTPIEIEKTPLDVGQTVIAVGKIAGDGSTAIASGILSATDRLWGIALQTDARVSSIFYGGALVDLQGRVLGVIVPIVPDDMGESMTAWYDSGVAFAIPVVDIQARLSQLIAGKEIKPGLMGVVAESNDPYVESTEIAAVRTRSPAAKAGLQSGDQITEMDGVKIHSQREIKQLIGSKDAGETITVRYRRGENNSEAKITLTDEIPPLVPQWIGITAIEQQEDKADDKSTTVTVSGTFDGSPAAEKLKMGDVIVSINDVPVASRDSLRRVVFAADPEEQLVFVVEREENGTKQPVTVKFKTASLATKLPESLPESLKFVVGDAWQIDEVKLPDISNSIVFVGPKPREAYESLAQSPGLLTLLADPGDQDLKKIASSWLKSAQAAGIAICLVAPATDNRWQPDEIDNIVRISTAITSRYATAAQMTSIGGIGDGPGSSMAMAVAMSRPGKFSGLYVTSASKPPAIRLRENDVAAPLEIMIRSTGDAEAPAWVTPLSRLGYTVHQEQGDQELILTWTRLLVRI